MPYNENFSVTQSLDCSTIEVTDTSTNPSRKVILGRKVFLQKADGSYFAPVSQQTYVYGTSASCLINNIALISAGTVYSIVVVRTGIGSTTIATYTQLSEDDTIPKLVAKLIIAINASSANIGFSATAATMDTNLVLVAPYYIGATANGYTGRISWLSTSTSNGFTGGVNGTTVTTVGLNYYDFSPFIFPTNKITIPIPKDYAVSIQQVSTPLSVVNGSVYAITKAFAFACNLRTFQLGKVSALSGTPTEINNVNFKQSLFNLQLELDNSDNAIANADIKSSQAAIDRAYELVNNQNKYF